MAHLEGAYEQVSQRLTSIDLRLDGIDRKSDLFRDAVDKKFDALDVKVDLLRNSLDAKIDLTRESLDAKIEKRFMWTIGVVVTTWLTSIGTTIAAVYLHH
jgi:hypothetical protein